jgi:hypothetical protein
MNPDSAGKAWPRDAFSLHTPAGLGLRLTLLICVSAALAGMMANASGLSHGLADDSLRQAAFWVSASFVVPAVIACPAGLRLHHLRKRQQGVVA